MESLNDTSEKTRPGKRAKALVMALFVCVFTAIGISASCVVNPTSSQLSQEADSKPSETPVPLQATEANKGKRCAPRVYSDVGQDEDFNPFCYEIQRRLVKAAHEGNLVEIRAALRDGANADGSVFDQYSSPLHTAAEAGQSDATRLLLDNGAPVNQGTFIIGTPLIAAARNGHKEVVKILLEKGADICVKADGGTAKEFAEKRGNKEIVELLKAAETANCK